MDPFTAQALKVLKDVLREKVIALVEYRAEVAALHDRALMTRPTPVTVQPPADDLYDETMAHIAREKALTKESHVPSCRRSCGH